ncbi:MAG: hypothetical protein PHX14_05245 [Syntrophomonadaceae bacterium]|nr:hypothetical protein [Syntrophomonadaceae bacterium]
MSLLKNRSINVLSIWGRDFAAKQKVRHHTLIAAFDNALTFTFIARSVSNSLLDNLRLPEAAFFFKLEALSEV